MATWKLFWINKQHYNNNNHLNKSWDINQQHKKKFLSKPQLLTLVSFGSQQKILHDLFNINQHKSQVINISYDILNSLWRFFIRIHTMNVLLPALAFVSLLLIINKNWVFFCSSVDCVCSHHFSFEVKWK